jgi:hypothetical protein
MMEAVPVAARITCPTCGYFIGLRLGEGGVRFALGWYLPAGGRLRVLCDHRRRVAAVRDGERYRPCNTVFWVDAQTGASTDDVEHLQSA